MHYRATSYDPLTGREIWRVGYDDGFSNVPRPVFGNGLVFIATGFQQPRLIAVRPDGSGDVTSTHVHPVALHTRVSTVPGSARL